MDSKKIDTYVITASRFDFDICGVGSNTIVTRKSAVEQGKLLSGLLYGRIPARVFEAALQELILLHGRKDPNDLKIMLKKLGWDVVDSKKMRDYYETSKRHDDDDSD